MRAPFANLLLLLAVSIAAPAAAQVEGTWNMTHMNNGSSLPARSPTEAGGTVTRASLVLNSAGRFELSMTANTSSGERTQRMAGTYTIHRGDRVSQDSIYLVNEAQSAAPLRLRWYRERDRLYLQDGQDESRWLREPMPVAGAPWRPETWSTVQMNGRALPAPWPTGRHVTVTEWTWAFTADGQLTGEWISNLNGEYGPARQEVRYRIEGEKLLLLHDDGTVNDEFLWTLRDGALRLVDDEGNDYLLRRQ